MSETFDYSDAKADADALIAEFGQSGVLRRQATSGPAHNPVITTEDFACTFVVEDYRAQEIDGSRVLVTDKRAILKAGGLAIVPTTSDKLVVGGVAHSIIRVETLAPGGTTLLWQLQIRR